eukprot:987001-Pyramimonas_sp.AAC.1
MPTVDPFAIPHVWIRPRYLSTCSNNLIARLLHVCYGCQRAIRFISKGGCPDAPVLKPVHEQEMRPMHNDIINDMTVQWS